MKTQAIEHTEIIGTILEVRRDTLTIVDANRLGQTELGKQYQTNIESLSSNVRDIHG